MLTTFVIVEPFDKGAASHNASICHRLFVSSQLSRDDGSACVLCAFSDLQIVVRDDCQGFVVTSSCQYLRGDAFVWGRDIGSYNNALMGVVVEDTRSSFYPALRVVYV